MNLKTGTSRAIIVFTLVALMLWLIFYLLGTLGINFFGEPLIILIGAGWSAYYIWKKTEVGRY